MRGKLDFRSEIFATGTGLLMWASSINMPTTNKSPYVIIGI